MICLMSAHSQERTLALPEGSGPLVADHLMREAAQDWSEGRAPRPLHHFYITFQMAEVAIPRTLFVEILRLIDGLRPAHLPP